MKNKRSRILAVLLTLALLVGTLSACSNRGKTLMSLEQDGIRVSISVNTYELMLSRIKAVLCNSGVTQGGVSPQSEAFWNYISKFDGVNEQTIDEYYQYCIQENCRTYLVSLYLFEKMGLTLPQAAIDDVEDRLQELVLTDGEGSKTKLNAYLSTFGVNYDILKETYLIEKKVTTLQESLYGANASLVGDDIKTDFMKSNYVHFRQIYLPTFTYLCEMDENNDIIYYYGQGVNQGRIYYDVFNGEPRLKEDGSKFVDENGDVIYYVKGTEYKKIAYDFTNGVPAYLTDEKDPSAYKTQKITDEAELKRLKDRAEELFASFQNATYAQFEAGIEAEFNKSSPKNDMEAHPDGYYLDRKVDYAASGSDYQYLTNIINKLDTMQDGEVALVPSAFGYHIIMKYPYTEKAYALEQNTVWFENFNDDLVESLFLKECKKHFDLIRLDEAVLKKAPNMKQVAINYYMI